MRATKNQAPWVAVGGGTFSKTSPQFYIVGQVGNSANSELLSLGFPLPASPQLTPVQALPASWVMLVGGDAVTYQSLRDGGCNRLTCLGDYAARYRGVEGRFQANLLREKKWTTQTETMQFTDGSFRVQYTTVP